MKNNFAKSLEIISNTNLDEFQKKVDQVKKIDVQDTLTKLKAAGKTDNDLYRSLFAIKDIDFDEYQKSLDVVKKLDLGLKGDMIRVHDQIDEIEISQKKAIFISYSHQDSMYLDRLKVHLKPLEKKGLILLWDDTKIKASDLWREEISKAIAQSTVAVLLISADFLASDFIVDNELPPLLKKAKLEGAKILPVILKQSGFERNNDLSQFQALNSPNSPVIGMGENEREKLWNDLAEIIHELL